MSTKKLKIYYTSDTHGYFYPTTYGDTKPKNVGLFSCITRYEKDENTLIIDGGDILQGNAFAYYLSHVPKNPKVIADIMNDCGYDYYTLGNHDFNYGPEYQKIYRDNMKARLVCQNILDKDGRCLYPYDIKVMPNGLRVGIVGIVTDYINVWEKKENICDVIVADPFEAAKEALAELCGRTDVNICIYHGGYECDLDTGKRLTTLTENVGYRICRELTFDLLLTGHQHMSFDGRYINSDIAGHRTYTMQPLEGGKEYCYVEMVVDDNNIMSTGEKIKADYTTAKQARTVVVKGNTVSAAPCDTAYNDVEKTTYANAKTAAGTYIIENLYDKYISTENDVQRWLNEPVGTLSRPIMPSDKLDMALHGTPIADFINRVQLYFSGAQISAVGLASEIAGFKSKVSTRDIIATYPYPNTLVVLRITGAALKAAMERSAEYFDIDGDGNVIISRKFLVPKVEHYNYDYFAGVDYEIDPYKPVGSRIIKLMYQGRPVAPDDEYTLCLNNYRASGAGEYPMYPECPVEKEINIEMVELLMEYFRMNPEIEV